MNGGRGAVQTGGGRAGGAVRPLRPERPTSPVEGAGRVTSMAKAAPSPTPNPDALKFTLDTTLPEMINVASAAEADTPFATAVFAAPGVANLFGVNDFVTVTRQPGADWEPIIG